MMRTFTALTTLAAVFALAGTASAEDMRLNLAGKTPAKAYAMIANAAKLVCIPVSDNIYSIYLDSPCVSETIAATLAKIGDPALLQYSKARKEFLVAAN